MKKTKSEKRLHNRQGLEMSGEEFKEVQQTDETRDEVRETLVLAETAYHGGETVCPGGETACHGRETACHRRETAKPEKCQMGMRRCAYLGYVVGGAEVRPQEEKIEAVRRCEVPRTKRDVRVFWV